MESTNSTRAIPTLGEEFRTALQKGIISSSWLTKCVNKYHVPLHFNPYYNSVQLIDDNLNGRIGYWLYSLKCSSYLTIRVQEIKTICEDGVKVPTQFDYTNAQSLYCVRLANMDDFRKIICIIQEIALINVDGPAC